MPILPKKTQLPAATFSADSMASTTEAVKASAIVRAAVRLYWDLTVTVSAAFGGNGVDVNREGYRNFHLRVSKSLESKFDMVTAEDVANKDWAEDITAFSGDSTDLIWLEEVKKKFREVTKDIIAKQGWAALFNRYDKNGSGDIDFEEFSAAARSDCAISLEMISDDDLRALFAEADDDGSGELDSEEFCNWMVSEDTQAQIGHPHLREVKAVFQEASAPIVTKIGWVVVFALQVHTQHPPRCDFQGNSERLLVITGTMPMARARSTKESSRWRCGGTAILARGLYQTRHLGRCLMRWMTMDLVRLTAKSSSSC